MAFTALRQLRFCLLFLILVDSNCLVSSVDDVNFLKKNAEYLLNQLTIAITKLQAAHGLSSTGSIRNIMSSNFSNSLHSVCSNFNTQPIEMTTTPPPEDVWKSKMEYNITYEEEDHPTSWTTHAILLISAATKRDGKTIRFSFKLNHTSQVFIIRKHTIGYIRKVVGPPGNYLEPVTSVVEYSVDVSECKAYDGSDIKYKTVYYTFGLVLNKEHTVNVYAELCNLYTSKKKSKSNRKAMMEDVQVRGELYQQLAPLKFRVLSQSLVNPDEILITPGVNPEFYIDIDSSAPETIFSVNAILWDWGAGKYLRKGCHIYEKYDFQEDDLFNCEIVNIYKTRTTAGVGSQDNDTSINTIIRAKITVNIGSKTISGRLVLGTIWHGNSYPVGRIKHEKNLNLRYPFKLSTMPDNKVLVGFSGKFECKNEAYKSCVLGCEAEGDNIRNIFIVKNEPYVPPVRYMAYVLGGYSAETLVDMGPPSAEIEGEYQCVTVTENGNVKTERGILLSTGFTVIHSTTVTDVGNGSALITCEASGFQPLHMSLEFINYLNTEVMFDLENKVYASETANNKSTLKALVDVEQLLFPTAKVMCTANGERGYKVNSIQLFKHLKIYNATSPNVIKDLFTMKHFKNGTTRISCTGSGGKDLTVDIFSPDYANDQHEIVHTDTRTDGIPTRTVVLYLPTYVVSRLRHETDVTCEARVSKGSAHVKLDQNHIEYF